MYAADALQEMLFGMSDGVIELFPAIPEKWKKQEISFKGFRGEKGILVSAKRVPKKGIEAVFCADREQTVKVRVTEQCIKEVSLHTGETLHIFFEEP